MTPELLGTIGIYLSAIVSTAGFLAFAAGARFWSSRGGWHVFWYMLMITWVLDLSAVAHAWDPPWFAWTRVITFTIGFPLVLGWRSWMIFDLQYLPRWRERRAYREADTNPEEGA